ncbi:hypothetical protein [Sphingopyxis sp. 550A]
MAMMVTGCSASTDMAGQGRVSDESDETGAPSNMDCPAFDYAQCLVLLPAEPMQGVWLSGFERSAFLSGAKAIPTERSGNAEAVWLDFAPTAAPDPALRAEMDRMGGTVAVVMEFDGRRSRDAGHYGPMGGADHVVVVDRIRSARILGSVGAN